MPPRMGYSVLAAGFLTLGLAAQASAWGNLGHRAVARLAQERLTPQTEKKLAELFDGDNALERVANCADWILHRRGSTDCGGLIRVPADEERVTARWHYMNVPISDKVSESSVAKYCADKTECVWGQVPRQVQVIRSGASLGKRRIAMMHLVHLVGDLHMPLHVGDDGDTGGNEATVSFPGGTKKLHGLWDGIIAIREWQSGGELDFEVLMKRLRADVARADTGSWTRGDTTTAAVLEGHKIARDDIYPVQRATGGTIGLDYQDKYQPVAFERLERAGVRLAALIELALSGPPSGRAFDAEIARLSIDKAVSDASLSLR